MSIALERGGGIGGSGFARGVNCFAAYEAEAPAPAAEGSGSDEGEEAEVQSSYKGPLDTMDALEESLPIRRGISKFYCGKSKSFTSLADAISSTSAKDLAKPENAYTRKRKNLLAFSITCEKSRNEDLIKMEGGIAKKPANSSRSTVNPISRSSSGSNSSSGSSSEEEHEPPRRLPPRHPHGKPASNAAFTSAFSRSSPQTFPVPMRSFSMIDLQGAGSSSSSIGSKVKSKRD
ncbi:uncharacterized protein LOC109723225 [Ananas comosus]|uniref:Uncharacterized protein LOC109723225 n=1 Tax=Ananas comosus TaxID=4615 RepID=A0A6P5GES2_ANACO|nr:uncharacterized protein LOC109723225 [Ananas comosus]